jgi:hypothetical protein
MDEQKLLEAPEPPIAVREVLFSVNDAGQRIFRIVTFSQWEVVPEQ